MPDDLQPFEQRRTQTEVKHWILERYLHAWGGIIIASNPVRVALCYVDTCCGSGLYERDPDDPPDPQRPYDFGSPIIGLKVLASLLAFGRSKGRAMSGSALFINESGQELATLEKAIAEFVPDRPAFERRTGMFADFAGDVVDACRGRFSFVFIDPYGPMAVPFSAVAPVVSGRFTDTIIHFPYYAVAKWTGWLEGNEQPQRLARVDAMMNGPEWRAVALQARRSGQPLQTALLEHYVSRLASLGVFTCSIPLLFPDRERVLYHLIFTTHKVSGLAAAKQKFQQAEHYQDYLREEERVRRTRQPALFSRADDPPTDPVDVEHLAETLRRRFSAGSHPFEAVTAHGLTLPHVLNGHVQKALRHLRSTGKATFTGQPTWKKEISFR